MFSLCQTSANFLRSAWWAPSDIYAVRCAWFAREIQWRGSPALVWRTSLALRRYPAPRLQLVRVPGGGASKRGSSQQFFLVSTFTRRQAGPRGPYKILRLYRVPTTRSPTHPSVTAKRNCKLAPANPPRTRRSKAWRSSRPRWLTLRPARSWASRPILQTPELFVKRSTHIIWHGVHCIPPLFTWRIELWGWGGRLGGPQLNNQSKPQVPI